MDYNDFRKETLKVNNKKNFKIKNSYTLNEAYLWLVKNIWNNEKKVSKKNFSLIIKEVNKAYANKLLNSSNIDLPYNMGRLEIVQNNNSVKYVNGKLIINKKIDWKSTLQLWYEDEEARKNKTIIRHDTNTYYSIHYRKSKAKFKNKVFIKFSVLRRLKILLKNKVNKGDINAFLKLSKNGIYKY